MSDALKRIEELSQLLIRQTLAVEDAEKALAAAKENKLRTEREDLPELMREFGLSEVKLENGAKVTVSDDVTAAIPEAQKAAAWAWLEARGYDGIIKTEVKIAYGRGENDDARAAAERLSEELARPAELSRSVHSATLKSFIKERMAAGETVPFDVFGVHAYAIAKVKLPKA